MGDGRGSTETTEEWVPPRVGEKWGERGLVCGDGIRGNGVGIGGRGED